MTEFVIREATDEDGPALAKLVGEAIVEHGADPAAGPRPELERPASHFARRGGRLWVVLRDGEMAGSLGLGAGARPKEFELSLLCLDKESRGEGFATALLAGAEAYAAASEGERLTLWVDTRFEDVHRFCERHGFLMQPGTRALHDGSEGLARQFARQVGKTPPV